MSGSTFPLSLHDEDGKALARAVNEIRSVRDSIYESIYCGYDGQYDNSASDGGSLALLALAEKLILDEIDGYPYRTLREVALSAARAAEEAGAR